MKSANHSFGLFVSLLLLLMVSSRVIFSLSIRDNNVRIRILEFDRDSGKLVQVVSSTNSDIILGEGISIENPVVLECRSSYGPVQFDYKGDGMPQYLTNTNITKTNHGQYFWTFLSFPRPSVAENTGNYTCKSVNNPLIKNSVYLFVPAPGSSVFVPNRVKNRMEYSRSDGSVRIPCSVVHPEASVSLERISRERVYRSFSMKKITYNPKVGFYIPLNIPGNVHSPLTFTCKAEYKGQRDEASYMFITQTESDPDSEIESITPETLESKTTKKSITKEGLISACTKDYCGVNAECIVLNFKPYCVCFEDYSGDPDKGCYKLSTYSEQYRVTDPCVPSPCGKNAECLAVNNHPVCSCWENYYGKPPYCKPNKDPRCSENDDCGSEEFCNEQTRKCESVCYGSVKNCAPHTSCFVINHTPFCSCQNGYRGDPYFKRGNPGCTPVESPRKVPCGNTACGRNTICKTSNSYGGGSSSCTCAPGYSGDPFDGCIKISQSERLTAPEFSENSCNKTSCGTNAKCSKGRNNRRQCTCLSGYDGDPYTSCASTTEESVVDIRVCNVCGPNSICEIRGGKISCECTPKAVGVPPACKIPKEPKCKDSSECPDDQACQSGKCLSPCSWSCSITANCVVTNHKAKCQCPEGYEGDPKLSCKKASPSRVTTTTPIPTETNVPDLSNHPCRINCGPNTVCRAVDYDEIQNYRDSLRDGRQDAHFFDILRTTANLNKGVYSECVCRRGFSGNPYTIGGCTPNLEDEESLFPVAVVMDPDPCKPNTPCGPFSVCTPYNGRAFCTCDKNAVGQPPNCKSKCNSDKDCLFNETCVGGICDDP